MGRSYSINGYVNAILQRSSSTLLVEGSTDKGAMYRIVAEKAPDSHIVVDEATLIEEYGTGAKEKIVRVRNRVQALAVRFPALKEKLVTLIDREWDGLPSSAEQLVDQWFPPTQEEMNFTTVGHSIENYYFCLDYVVEYLRYAYAEHYTSALRDELFRTFPAIIALAGATSFEASSAAIISRFDGLFRIEHIEYRDECFFISNSFCIAAGRRGIANADRFVDEVNRSIDQVWSKLGQAAHAKWLPHGHVGTDIVWSCVGDVSKRFGLPSAVCERIANGDKKERLRHCHDWLSRLGDGEATSPLIGAVLRLVRA
jgi:hypothetical protein